VLVSTGYCGLVDASVYSYPRSPVAVLLLFFDTRAPRPPSPPFSNLLSDIATATMSSRLNKQEARRAGFKKAIDGDEARRKREDHQVEIRKAKREENLLKKRRETTGSSSAAPGVGGDVAAVDSLIDSNVRGTDAAVLERLPQMVRGVMSANGAEQMQYTLEFRKLLSIGTYRRSRVRAGRSLFPWCLSFFFLSGCRTWVYGDCGRLKAARSVEHACDWRGGW